MEFSFSEELLEIKRIARDFAEREIRSHVMEWDEKQNFPRHILKSLAELGFLGVLIPAEYGGAGLGHTEYVTIVEELSRVDGSIGISVAAHNSLCTGHIFNFGSEEQRHRFVVPLAKGEKIGAWSLTEPEAGSDAGGTLTFARSDGDHWILNGQKTFTTHGTIGDICVAMAVTDKSAGHHGISAFILEKGMPGFFSGKKENKLGLRASDTSTVIFEDCWVPKENLLGEPGHGFKLADMATEIDAARLLMHRAAWMKDRGMQTTAQSSMAKLYAGEVAVRVANECVQIHGGYGYIKEYPAEKFYRDVKLCTIGEGTSEIQRLVIAREILRS